VRQHSPNYDIIVKLSPDTHVIVDRLSTLADKMQKKVAVAATRRAMGIVKKTAVANAKLLDDKDTPERIWKNVVVQNAPKSGKRLGGVYMRVGVMGGAKQYANTKENVRKRRVGKSYKTSGDKGNPGGDTWYWRFLEFGTSKIGAKKFLRNALESNSQAVTDSLTTELTKGIDKATAEVLRGKK
jgi:HK97 gp10 family phage protein